MFPLKNLARKGLWVTSQAMEQAYDGAIVNDVTLKDIGKINQLLTATSVLYNKAQIAYIIRWMSLHLLFPSSRSFHSFSSNFKIFSFSCCYDNSDFFPLQRLKTREYFIVMLVKWTVKLSR